MPTPATRRVTNSPVIPDGVTIYLDADHLVPVAQGEIFATDTVYIVSAGSNLPAALTYVALDSYLAESAPVQATAIIPTPATFIGTAGDDVANASTGVLTGFTGGNVLSLTDRVGDTYRPGGGTDTIVAGRGNDVIEIAAAERHRRRAMCSMAAVERIFSISAR